MRTSEILDLIDRHGGVVRTRTLKLAGASVRDIERSLRGQSVLRLREGVYSLAWTDPLVVTAARHGGELACISALRAHGVWVLDAPGRTHVWLGGKGRAHVHPACRCVDHHDAGDAAFGVTSVPHALVQSARCCTDEAFFAAYESAWNKGLLTRADRVWIREQLPARSRWLVDRARHDAESGLESILRLRLMKLGIALETQVFITGVGRVDFVVAGRLILEVDGRENHDGQSKRHKDLIRDAAAAALGYETLRFDYAMVVHRWPLVERAILARLRWHRGQSSDGM